MRICSKGKDFKIVSFIFYLMGGLLIPFDMSLVAFYNPNVRSALAMDMKLPSHLRLTIPLPIVVVIGKC